MKLTYEHKIEIYQLRKQGKSLKNLSQIYDIAFNLCLYYLTSNSIWKFDNLSKKKRVKNFGANS